MAAASSTTCDRVEIEAAQSGVTTITVIHDVEGAPGTAAMVAGAIEGTGGGWSFVLSDLKTLLETGRSLEGFEELLLPLTCGAGTMWAVVCAWTSSRLAAPPRVHDRNERRAR